MLSRPSASSNAYLVVPPIKMSFTFFIRNQSIRDLHVEGQKVLYPILTLSTYIFQGTRCTVEINQQYCNMVRRDAKIRNPMKQALSQVPYIKNTCNRNVISVLNCQLKNIFLIVNKEKTANKQSNGFNPFAVKTFFDLPIHSFSW